MDAFRSADQVLLSGVQGITDLITTPGLINLDFADVKSVMSGAGSALMGIGSARGDNRARQAAEIAIASPLLEASMEGAHGVLLSIYGGSDLGLFEINEAASLVAEAAHPDANIIFGAVIDDTLGDEVRVTVIAAGFDSGQLPYKKVEIRREPVPPGRRHPRPRPAATSAASTHESATDRTLVPRRRRSAHGAAARRPASDAATAAPARRDRRSTWTTIWTSPTSSSPEPLTASASVRLGAGRRDRSASELRRRALADVRGAQPHRRRRERRRPGPGIGHACSRSPRRSRRRTPPMLLGLGVVDLGESRDQEAGAKVAEVAELAPAAVAGGPVALRRHAAVAQGPVGGRATRTPCTASTGWSWSSRLAAARSAPDATALEVFVAGEPGRRSRAAGVSPRPELAALADAVAGHRGARLRGVMAVAPLERGARRGLRATGRGERPRCAPQHPQRRCDLGRHERGPRGGHRARRDTRACRIGVARPPEPPFSASVGVKSNPDCHMRHCCLPDIRRTNARSDAQDGRLPRSGRGRRLRRRLPRRRRRPERVRAPGRLRRAARPPASHAMPRAPASWRDAGDARARRDASRVVAYADGRRDDYAAPPRRRSRRRRTGSPRCTRAPTTRRARSASTSARAPR